jgi:hypothetical protein
MERSIAEAIEERLVITFLYKGSIRTVEPHTYGMGTNGLDMLCGWQLKGGSGISFRSYIVSEMIEIDQTDTKFHEPRPGYKKNDDAFTIIYRQL